MCFHQVTIDLVAIKSIGYTLYHVICTFVLLYYTLHTAKKKKIAYIEKMMTKSRSGNVFPRRLHTHKIWPCIIFFFFSLKIGRRLVAVAIRQWKKMIADEGSWGDDVTSKASEINNIVKTEPKFYLFSKSCQQEKWILNLYSPNILLFFLVFVQGSVW